MLPGTEQLWLTARDQAGDNALAALGWRVLRYTRSDVVHRSDRVLMEVHAALGCGHACFQVFGQAADDAA